jgi:hypothetical protein
LFPLLFIVAWPARGDAPEISTISIPIRTDLGPISADIDKRVESTFTGTATERGIDIDYRVDREPIQLMMVGAGLHSSTTAKYSMQACRGRFPCVSCGLGESRRIAEIKLHTKLTWDPTWRLRSITTLLPVNYARPCQVTWLNIDVTRRFVAPVVEQQLTAAARVIDRNVPAMTNIRPQAEQIWSALQAPTELAPRTWLVFEPADVALTPISGAGTTMMTTLLLRANTRVIVGEKPAATSRPLPPLKSTVSANAAAAMRVPFDLLLPYAEASALASRDYAGKTYRVRGKPLTLESIRLAPGTYGRVAFEAVIDYRGGALRNYHGVVNLEGTPRFDPATSSIVIPDLDYSLASRHRGLFARIAERAAHESIRNRLRESARFPLADRLASIRAEMTRALTRTLGPGVQMRGRADTIEPQSVTPLLDAIEVHVIATGAAEVELRR